MTDLSNYTETNGNTNTNANTNTNTPKRSLSPDEGEVVDDVKRRRNRSPAINHARDDTRRHRIVYEGERGGGGYRRR